MMGMTFLFHLEAEDAIQAAQHRRGQVQEIATAKRKADGDICAHY